MKAYVVPVENYCNATCFFCITKFKRETRFGTFLNPTDLTKLKNLSKIDVIEITGGGEPLINPKIEEIVKEAQELYPTILYTNGKLLFRLNDETLKKLFKLTISRHHFDNKKNTDLMGINYPDSMISDYIKSGITVRLTIVLNKRGIKTGQEVLDYIDWADSLGVKQIQFRQFFDFEYWDNSKQEFVRTANILKEMQGLRKGLKIHKEKYDTLYHKDIKIEFEGDKCACGHGVPNLRGNGELYYGWTDKTLPKRFFI